jgi:Tol biopolymer transport system component
MSTYPGGRPALWVRDLGSDEARQIPNADDARFPFWSPDSRFVAFFGEGKLQSVNPADGAVVTICDAPQAVGGTWSRDGTIVFAPTGTSPLFRVAASGGNPVAVTKLNAARHEVAHRYPWFLPDGRRFLYLAMDLGAVVAGDNAIRVASLDGKLDKALVSAISNAQFASGQLIYARNANLVAQQFDLDRLVTSGDPVLVAPLVDRGSDWTGFFTFASSDGVLLASRIYASPSRLTWYDRTGRSLGSIGEPALYLGPRLSPDGRTIAVQIPSFAKSTSEIWTYDVASGLGSKFVFAPYWNSDPAWSADSARVFFASDRKVRIQRGDIWERSVNGASEQSYLESQDQLTPLDWSHDGRHLAVMKVPLRERNYQIWVVDGADLKHQIPVAIDPSDHTEARFSPDARWIAFQSNESGANEVYVQPFPGPGGKWKVSVAGGLAPRWRGDGREIYYLTPEGKVMAIPISLAPSFQPGPPVVLFSKRNAGWDAAADGQRFLINSLPEDTGSPPLTMLINWTALLTKIEPPR